MQSFGDAGGSALRWASGDGLMSVAWEGVREKVGLREDETSSLFPLVIFLLVPRVFSYFYRCFSLFSLSATVTRTSTGSPPGQYHLLVGTGLGWWPQVLGGGCGGRRCHRQGCTRFPQPYHPSIGDTDEVNFDVVH